MAIVAIYRRARPKVLGALLRRFGDMTLAEDALQEAITRAYSSWSGKGMPDNPETWLYVTARNQAIDTLRKHHREAPLTEDEADSPTQPDLLYNSDILRLFFVCSDPLLSRPQQITLALNVLAGIPCPSLARTFLVSEAAMEKRLSRAKQAANQLAITTATPFLAPKRLDAVKSMLYLLFTEGYNAASSPMRNQISFSDEAIALTRNLLALLPEDTEIHSLLALMLYSQSRREARFQECNPVPLDQQDRSLWDQHMIAEASSLLARTNGAAPPGYYRLQACISGAHSTAKSAGDTDWKDIRHLYHALYKLHPTPVIALNRAVATAHVISPKQALDDIAAIGESLSRYQYFHSTRAHLLKMDGQHQPAIDAFKQALSLSQLDWEQKYIQQEIQLLASQKKNKK
ncbi:RNA polymerase sigma factor [Grimontia hollisae]|uniref:RNA polymerase sigma factor n=1 Tax=Grimontia hollisae TaxID=673 RepID=UPI000E037FBD|nr:sigma-70 family RNA polymerase sigma factor [Grimontia hollisae]STQ76581.1 RNA polymerase sigma factor sigM [Grimontia hollisae]